MKEAGVDGKIILGDVKEKSLWKVRVQEKHRSQKNIEEFSEHPGLGVQNG